MFELVAEGIWKSRKQNLHNLRAREVQHILRVGADSTFYLSKDEGKQFEVKAFNAVSQHYPIQGPVC